VLAALRELREETSLVVAAEQLEPLGTIPYKRDKDLALWLHRTQALPDVSLLSCESRFDAGNGVTKTEMDGFKLVAWDKTEKYVVPAMQSVLQLVRKRIA
jgi:8-oxo-dGTP pyrophosphatase MutT (NUDIX family)